MLALIKREIEDLPVYLLITSVLTAAMIIFLFSYTKYSDQWHGDGIIVTTVIFTISSFLIFTAIGVSQMYSDRLRGISTFLVTHAVGRRHVFAARLIVGFLIHLFVYGSVTIAVLVLIQQLPPPTIAFQEYVIKRAIDIFLLSFACYSMGLLVGFTSSKITTLSAIVMIVLFLSLIIVKGFGIPTVVLASVVIMASLVRSWSNYKNAAI